jgi:hypothetical protein
MSKRTALLGFSTLALACSPCLHAQEEEDAPPAVSGPADAPPIPLKRAKSTIHTVLFVPVPGTGSAAKAVQITGTATPAAPGSAVLAFDRLLGPLALPALNNLTACVRSLHRGWPQGQRVQLAFSERPTPAEVQPASLASVLLLDSMLRDWEPEPSYAPLGELKPDGSIGAVGGIAGRLSGAARAQMARVAVPEKNRAQVADYLLAEGIAAFVGTQVFTVNHYNDAGVLALTKLSPRTAGVVELFGSVQRTLIGVGPARAEGMLHSEGVQTTLQRVLAEAPNHLSARVLFDWGTGQRTQISLDGSTDAIDRHANDLMSAFRAPNNNAFKTPREKVTEDVNRLRVLRNRVDPRAQPWADALLRFGEALQKAQASGGRSLSKAGDAALAAAREQGSAEWSKLVQMKLSAPAKAAP